MNEQILALDRLNRDARAGGPKFAIYALKYRAMRNGWRGGWPRGGRRD